MKRNGWARVRPPGIDGLRRGAWYPVVDDSAPDSVVLDVRGEKITVPRLRVHIRRLKPERCGVVVRAPDDYNPARGTPEDLGSRYAVCPQCHARVGLTGQPEYVDCTGCRCRFAVAWEETC